MPFTEVQARGNRSYYYRVRSVRKLGKVAKERIYLGADLDKRRLAKKEREADQEFGVLSALLTKADEAFLRDVKRRYRRAPKSTWLNRYESFVSLFTHDSTAIEGNTLTLRETSDLLFEGRVPAKSLREVNEVVNHKKAFDHLLAHRGDITKPFICRLHALVVQDTLPHEVAAQTGRYRDVQVYIRGVEWVPPPADAVANDMRTLVQWYSKSRSKFNPVVAAAYFHVAFELIHPFVDGNGRVGRLLMNFILHKHGYPMINIPNRDKELYYRALHEGQVNGDLRPFVALMLDIYRKSGLPF